MQGVSGGLSMWRLRTPCLAAEGKPIDAKTTAHNPGLIRSARKKRGIEPVWPAGIEDELLRQAAGKPHRLEIKNIFTLSDAPSR